MSRNDRRTMISDHVLLTTLAAGIPVDDIHLHRTTVPNLTTGQVVEILHDRRLLEWRLVGDAGDVIACAEPLSTGEPWPNFDADGGKDLSRFVTMRPHGEKWVLESGASRWEVQLDATGVSKLTAADEEILRFLAPLGLLNDIDASPSLMTWEPLDLLFATRNRIELAPERCGNRFPFRGSLDRPSYDQAAEFSGVRIPLPSPTNLPSVDFGSLAAQRSSKRSFRQEPLSLELLSSLLWHTLRVTDLAPADSEDPDSYDVAFRPVASSGAAAVIDAWVMARNVRGVACGTWWYNPLTHELHQTSSRTVESELAPPAPIAILLASRHERLAWKYERLAFSLALRDAGVIIHALQLTAEALGLGATAWGAGAISDVSQAMGTDPFRRMPVGEVYIGIPTGE